MMSSTAAADFSFRTTTKGEEEDLGVTATKSTSGGFQRASSSSPEKRRHRTPNEFEEDEGG